MSTTQMHPVRSSGRVGLNGILEGMYCLAAATGLSDFVSNDVLAELNTR